MKPVEIGSFQALDDGLIGSPGSNESARQALANAILLSSCRGAIALLAGASATSRTLHVPGYFCADVEAYLARHVTLKRYEDLPDSRAPVFDSISAGPGDSVLAVNMLGVKDMTSWRDWKQANPDNLLIEDQTHAPLPDLLETSVADWCVASLRKLLPLPDGACIIRGSGNVAAEPRWPEQLMPEESAGNCLSLMRLHHRYLAGDSSVKKEDFLPALRAHEASFAVGPPIGISPVSAELLQRVDIFALDSATQAARHVTAEMLRDVVFENFRVSPASLEPGASGYSYLFGFCHTPEHRTRLREKLADRGIFVPVHWAGVFGGGRTRLLADTQFTLPIDYRCSVEDCARLVDSLIAVDRLLCRR